MSNAGLTAEHSNAFRLPSPRATSDRYRPVGPSRSSTSPAGAGRVNECAVSGLREWNAMRTRSRSTDEQLLRRLLAPPDLDDGVQSLGYWRQRSRHLPWYQMSARREAAQMTIRWEQRVGAALVAQRGAPASIRLSAGLLLARTRLRRWTRRARIALVATATSRSRSWPFPPPPRWRFCCTPCDPPAGSP